MRGYTIEELAEHAGLDVEYIERLAAQGILKPSAGGSLTEGGQEVVDACTESGVAFDEVGPVELKGFSGALQSHVAHRSDEAECAAEEGVMMEIEVSTVVDRPVATVWEFYAVDHVENHPRWDPDLELEKTSDGPIGLGTRIRRRNTRYDTPTEGSMEIIEFEPERVLGVRIHDGPITTRGRATFSAATPGSTEMTIWAEFPGMDDSMADTIRPLMERSARTIKQLIEAET